MSDQNNMYVGGSKTERDWLKIRQRIFNKFLTLFLRNHNKPIATPKDILLPTQFRDVFPDLRNKYLRKIDYSAFNNATNEELREEIDWIQSNVGWYHSIDLPNGISTPGSRGWERRGSIFNIPNLVKNSSVLDIGSMEGGDTFFAEACGAEVTSFDVDNYLEYDLGLNAARDYAYVQYNTAKERGVEQEFVFLNSKRFGWEFCKAAKNSSANRISGSIYDLDPDKHGVFDYVYCFGLMYHLRNPIHAMDKIYSVTRKAALFNNHVFTGFSPSRHTLQYYNDTWQGAYTNWFVPSPRAFVDMLSSIGFRRIEVLACSETNISVLCHK